VKDIFLFAGADATQQAAYPLKDQVHRIVANSVANAWPALKGIFSNEAPGMVFITNDSANTVVVFPFKNFAAGATIRARTRPLCE
jgi:hypothetical protein